MNDFDYTIDPGLIYPGAAHKACRAAALWPLIRRRDKPDLPTAYARLHKLWRSRVGVLAGAGWRATASTVRKLPDGSEAGCTADLRVTYLHNCPPFGAKVAVRGHECKRPRACPMCFARQVVLEAYKTVEWAFFMDLNATVMPGVRLVAVRRVFDELPLSSGTPAAWLDKAQAKRSNELTALARVRGGICLVTLEPGAPGFCLARRSTILAVPAGEPLDAVADKPATDHRVVDGGDLSRALIAKTVAWAFGYPPGMMFGEPSVAAAILNAAATRRSKLLTTSGCMRNRTVRSSATGTAATGGANELE